MFSRPRPFYKREEVPALERILPFPGYRSSHTLTAFLLLRAQTTGPFSPYVSRAGPCAAVTP